MFTGIIEKTGVIKKIGKNNLTIAARNFLADVKIGDSIAVNGVCLTVIDLDGGKFKIELMPETLRLTNFSNLKSGDKVNLEKSLKVGDKLDGHLVLGHVDGVCKVSKVHKVKSDVVLEFKTPRESMSYIARKGSVALDGVSLTVVDVNRRSGIFTVALIPHTLKNTTLDDKKLGDRVNIEVDILAKYLKNMVSV